MSQENHAFLALLAKLFSPNLEITLFKDDEEKQRWGELSAHKADRSGEGFSASSEVTLGTLANGKVVKTMICTLGDELVRMRVDVSIYSTLQNHIQQVLGQNTHQESLSWQQYIDDAIQHYSREQHKPMDALSKEDKIALTRALDGRGLLNYKEATAYVAAKLDVSRGTIYNYLNWSKAVKTMVVHQVNAFTEKGGKGGNPAGVVLCADDLTEPMMKNIARQLQFSETAFVVKDKKEGDLRHLTMRYFTRTGVEVSFCGHSSIGVLCMLQKKDHEQGSPNQKMCLHTALGEVAADMGPDFILSYGNPPVVFEAPPINQETLLNALEIDENDMLSGSEIMYESQNKLLYIAVNSLKNMTKMAPNFKRLKQLSKANNVVAVCVVTMESEQKENDMQIRCFCPGVGIDEDAVTGCLGQGLVAFVDKLGLLKSNQLIVEQGHCIGMPGIMRLEIEQKGKTMHVITHATAKHFSSSEVYLD